VGKKETDRACVFLCFCALRVRLLGRSAIVGVRGVVVRACPLCQLKMRCIARRARKRRRKRNVGVRRGRPRLK
jgi:hypothetical protein